MFGKLLNRFGKFLHWMFIIFIRSCFVATSLAPVFFVLSIGELERYFSLKDTDIEIGLCSFVTYLIISIVLWIACWFMLWLICFKITRTIPIDNINKKENELLSFLFIFLLPLVRGGESLFGNQLVTTIVCFLIIILAIADIGAYHFNPIIRLWGYRIYSIKVGDSDSILIAKSRRILKSMSDGRLKAVDIANGVYIHNWKRMRE